MVRTLVTILVLAVGASCAPAGESPDAGSPAATPEAGATAADTSHGTLAEATAMLEAAAAHYEEAGREAALADFTAGNEPFRDRDLYVFCYGPDRTISAHGADAGLIGAPIDELRDVEGKAFATEIWEVAHRPGGGTVEYHWLNPVTGEVEAKVSAVRLLGEDVCGVGAYGGR